MKEIHGVEDNFKLNGVYVDDAIRELSQAYLKQAEKGDKAVPADHPFIVRQRRVSDNLRGLEYIVKGVLGTSIKLDSNNLEDVKKAEDITHKLAYVLAQSDGFKGKPEELDDEKVRKYLTEAGEATGNPTIRNKTELIKSILNLAAVKPGDPLYDNASALARLIEYIATQKDDKSRRINYLNTLIGEKWAMPEYGIKLQKKIGETFRLPLDPTATAGEALSEINRRSQLESQLYAQTRGKTYLKPEGSGTQHATH